MVFCGVLDLYQTYYPAILQYLQNFWSKEKPPLIIFVYLTPFLETKVPNDIIIGEHVDGNEETQQFVKYSNPSFDVELGIARKCIIFHSLHYICSFRLQQRSGCGSDFIRPESCSTTECR